MRSVLADLRRDLDKRSLPEILLRDLSERTCTDILFKDLWSLAKILPRDFLQREGERELAQRSCHKTSFTDLLPQPLIQISCRDLAKRSLTEIILRDLHWRAWTEILFRNLQQAITWRGFFGDLGTGSLQRCCVDLLQRSCQETCTETLYKDLQAMFYSLLDARCFRREHVQKPRQETYYKELVQRSYVIRDLLHRSCQETCHRDLAPVFLYRDIDRDLPQKTWRREPTQYLLCRHSTDIFAKDIAQKFLQTSQGDLAHDPQRSSHIFTKGACRIPGISSACSLQHGLGFLCRIIVCRFRNSGISRILLQVKNEMRPHFCKSK